MSHSWNFAPANALQTANILEKMLRPLMAAGNACAIVQGDETPLLVVPQSSADAVTLSTSATTCRRYLKLKNRDVALLNDPGSGGTWLTHVTLVAGLSLTGGEAELLFVSRFNVNPPTFGKKGHLSEEGVQIPPMPIAQSGNVNSEILKAIAQHPMAAKNFATRLESEIALLLQSVAGAERVLHMHERDWPERIKNYLQDSSRAFENAMARLPLGGMSVSTTLSTGALLKLHLEVNERMIQFDFKGTDDSLALGLTEHVTFGVCVSAILKWTASKLPINAGMISHFQLSAPQKSLLSSKFPMGTWRGANEVLPALSTLIEAALTKLAKTPQAAVSKLEPRHLELELVANAADQSTFPMKNADVSIESVEQNWSMAVTSVTSSPT